MNDSYERAMPVSDTASGIVAAFIAIFGVGGLVGWLHVRLNRVDQDSIERDAAIQGAQTVLERDVNARFERMIERMGGVATRTDLERMENKLMDAIREGRSFPRARQHSGND